MLKSVLAGSTVLALASLVGCAEPQLVEEQGESSSHQETTRSTSQATADLDELEAKANRCEFFNQADLNKLRPYTGMIDFTFEAYVSFKCSVEEGVIVVGEAAMETRAGWSSKDGSFSEEAVSATASVNIPVQLVNVSGSVTSEVRVRQTATTVTHDESVSAAVGVSKDFGLVTGSAQVSFDGTAAAISGGVSAPLVINVTDCQGKESVGLTVSLSAEHVDTAPRAIAERAARIQLQNVRNNDFYNAVGYFMTGDTAAADQAKQMCCHREKTCD